MRRDKQELLEYRPSLYTGPDSSRGFEGGPGPYSHEVGGPLNLRPFWVEPRNLLPHNMYLASEIQLADRSKIQANVVGAAAIGTLALSIGGENMLKGYIGALSLAWVLWLIDCPHGLAESLTSPELREALSF